MGAGSAPPGVCFTLTRAPATDKSVTPETAAPTVTTPVRKARYSHRRNWISADQFRTRRSNRSEPVIHINAEVSGISLRGIKRHAAIYDVYAELDNGRRIPLRDLEGSLHSGNSFTRHFKEPRYVKKLVLHVGPEYRHQRAYVSVDYLLAKNHGGRSYISHERSRNSH